MSCYFRHIKDILQEAGISVSAENRKQVDHAIHKILGSPYKNCPSTWKKIKHQIIEDDQKRQEFIDKLKHSV